MGLLPREVLENVHEGDAEAFLHAAGKDSDANAAHAHVHTQRSSSCKQFAIFCQIAVCSDGIRRCAARS